MNPKPLAAYHSIEERHEKDGKCIRFSPDLPEIQGVISPASNFSGKYEGSAFTIFKGVKKIKKEIR